MSWVTKTQEADLENAVKRAADNASNSKGRATLMFCSTADEGAFAGEVYPVDYADSVVSVAATDTWGGLTSKSDRQKLVDRGSGGSSAPVSRECALQSIGILRRNSFGGRHSLVGIASAQDIQRRQRRPAALLHQERYHAGFQPDGRQ